MYIFEVKYDVNGYPRTAIVSACDIEQAMSKVKKFEIVDENMEPSLFFISIAKISGINYLIP